MKDRKFKAGDEVKVLRSTHSGIGPADIGTVSHILPDKEKGYGVSFEKVWPQILSHVAPTAERRTIYFEENNLTLANNQTNQDSSDRPIRK